MRRFFIVSFVILFLVMALSTSVKEGFLENACIGQDNCKDCANTSGCSWEETKCVRSDLLNRDIEIGGGNRHRERNAIASSFLCPSELDDKIPPEAVVSNDIMYDFVLYKNQITDRIPPPNVYTTSNMEYSPETVMGQVKHLERVMQTNQKNLPGIIASTVQQNIRPMVVGILSDNYVIQA